jgi:hypothetical protein
MTPGFPDPDKIRDIMEAAWKDLVRHAAEHGKDNFIADGKMPDYGWWRDDKEKLDTD